MDYSSIEKAQTLLRNADRLYTAEEVTATLDRLATEISAFFERLNPVMLVVMHGGLIPAGRLFSRLDFPFRLGYLHVTRYRGATRGGELHWIARSSTSVEGCVVLVVDDIYDEGFTLKAIVEDLRRSGAKEVYTAVLVNKIHDRKEPGFKADFVGLQVDDRYVVGCGMDYQEYLRNLPAIYALNEPS